MAEVPGVVIAYRSHLEPVEGPHWLEVVNVGGNGARQLHKCPLPREVESWHLLASWFPRNLAGVDCATTRRSKSPTAPHVASKHSMIPFSKPYRSIPRENTACLVPASSGSVSPESCGSGQ